MVLGWHQLPNLLTLLRIALILPFALGVYGGNYRLALILFLLAGLSDAMDGYLARRFEWRSRFGAIADPLADKLLLVTAYVMLVWVGAAPLWLLVLVMGRDVLIVAGGLAYHRLVGRFDIQPSRLGKLNTLIQIVYVLMVMIDRAGLALHQQLLEAGLLLIAGSTLLSGAHYVVVWGARGWRHRRK